MLIIGIILSIISIFVLIYAIDLSKKTHIYNEEIDKQNQELQKKNEQLKKEETKAQGEYTTLISSINLQKQRLNDLQDSENLLLENRKQLSQEAFENYCEILNKQYEEKEEEYDIYKNTLQTSYSNLQLELMQELESVQSDLNKIKATRAAAIQANLREKEIEEQLSFYCLQISENDLKDIAVLETVAPKLNSPRVLYMLIWTTFFRTPMKTLCTNVIGSTSKTGIYKITNIKTKECYIGQAANLQDRWVEHCKAGLKIDTPAGNKLYNAMQEYGIWNFSWEVLEECPSSQLNEKERYYINLYDSYNNGYNKNKGVSK